MPATSKIFSTIQTCGFKGIYMEHDELDFCIGVSPTENFSYHEPPKKESQPYAGASYSYAITAIATVGLLIGLFMAASSVILPGLALTVFSAYQLINNAIIDLHEEKTFSPPSSNLI